MKKLVSLVMVSLVVCCVFGLANDQEQPAQTGTAAPQAPPELTEMQLIQKIQASIANATETAKLCEEFVARFATSPNIAFVRFQATLAYQRLNNFDKLEEHGKATLALIPGNPAILAILANGYAENNKVDEAEADADQALSAVNNMVKPAEMAQDQWDMQIGELKGNLYSTLGYVHLQRASKAGKTDKAREGELNKTIEFFQKAIQSNKMDDISYYRMGIAYALLNKKDDSLASYAKAVAIGQTSAPMAKTDMEKILKTLQDTKQIGDITYDKLIEKAKQDLGIQ